jgi:hypothetical protein
MDTERARTKTPTWLYSMHPRVMMWQPHCLGDALPHPSKGGDESDHIQVELVYKEHSCEQVESKLFSFHVILVIFNIVGFIENKRTSCKLLILCVVILNKCKNKNTLTSLATILTPD